ncbi:MAG TPA: hypothetical protein VII47_06970 [Actinomycetota bacterium]
MSVREATFDDGRAARRTSGTAALRTRTGTAGAVGAMGAITAILAAQFWGLTATLTAWQSGNGAALRGSLAFQAICTVAALAIGRSARR